MIGRSLRLNRRRVALAVATALTLTACGRATYPQTAMDPAGPVARAQDALWDLVLPIAIAIFVLVEGAILYTLFRFRDKGGKAIPKQIAGNTKLEIAWTIVPAVILAGVAVPTVSTIFDQAQPPSEDALRVRVIAKQYWWGFEYLGTDGDTVKTATELHIPAGRPVYLEMQSLSSQVPDPGPDHGLDSGQENRGVLHSFWVPALAGKQDVVPTHERTLTIEADEPGTYPGQCAEFCGLSHARMKFWVIAQQPDEFEQWLSDQDEPADEPQSELAQRGYEQFEEATCNTCHAIEGYEDSSGGPADIRIGPNLTHFASREHFAGDFENNEENLRRWLRNPQDMKPGAQMPNLELSDQQIDSLTAYLQSLD